MKKSVSLLVILLCIPLCAYSQTEKNNHFGIRADISTNAAYKTAEYDNSENTSLGIGGTLRGTYKFFLKKNSGWYIEPEVSIDYTILQYAWIGWDGGNGHYIDNSYAELGLGVSSMVGYDFALGKQTSLELYTGPELRYAPYRQFVSYEFHPDRDHGTFFEPIQFRWRVGVGVNYKSWNYHLSITHDLTKHQTYGADRKFRYLSVGVGYNF